MTPSSNQPDRPSPPNILFFLIDDMGWQDTSVEFHSEPTALNRRYHTPNMERLAADGVKFTQAYACPLCSPTRVSYLTGMNAARHMVTNWTLRKDCEPDNDHPVVQAARWNLNGLSPVSGIDRTVTATTLPSVLKTAGYRSIHCGKGHFGAHGTPGADPANLGFDINIAGHAAGGPGSYYGKNNFSAAWRDGDRIWDVPGLEKYHGVDINLTEALTREAIAEMERSVSDRVPFYLYMSHYAIHAPWEKDERFYAKYADAGLTDFEATYASMIESQDHSLGDFLDAIKRLEIENETIVVFMTDNGQPKQAPRNRPLRGHKITPYEGGIRVPLIVRWPGVVEGASTCSDDYVIIEDLFPTFLEMAGIDTLEGVEQTIDGVSFVPLLQGESHGPKDRPIFWHYPNTYDEEPYSVVRSGFWKLIYRHADGSLELYNLDDDIGERNDMANNRPEKVTELASILSNHLRQSGARMSIEKRSGKEVPFPDAI
jgi:arylsulfatase A-like enzyme